MKSYFFPIISVSLFVAGVSAQLAVDTPANVVSCALLSITFHGGTPPYIILSVNIYPGAMPNGEYLGTLQGVFTSPYNWRGVNFPPGTSLVLAIHDNYGGYALTAPFTVEPGISTDCLNGPASGPNASAPTSAAATTAGTIRSTKAGRGPITSSLSSASKAASPSSSANAAIVPGIPYGVASVLWVVIAAIFV